MSNDTNYDISSRSYTIPRGLMALNFLSYSEKMIINRIIGLSAKYIDKGGCTLSNGAIAEAQECTPGTISVAISKAAWLGFVTKREDTLDKYENGNGTTSITQTRRIVMVMPDFFEYLGELWGEGYYAQNKDAREILKQVNILLAEAFKKSSKENNGIEIAINSLLSCLLTEDGIHDYLNTPKGNIFCPPKEKSLGVLIKNPSLFKFWEFKVLGNQSSGKRLRECSLRSHSLPDSDEKEKKMDDIIPKKRIRKESSIPSKKDPEPIIDKNKEFYPLAERLAAMVDKHRHLSTPSKHIKAWANEIRLCKTEYKTTIERITRVIDWYEKHIGEKFVPQAFSGSSFRIKFTSLLDAIERSKEDSRPKRSSRSENPHTKQSEFLNNDPGKFKNIVVEKFIS